MSRTSPRDTRKSHPPAPPSSSSASTTTGRTHSIPEETKLDASALATVNRKNREAAARIKQGLIATQPVRSKDEGSLPDVGSLKLDPPQSETPLASSSDHDMSKAVTFSGKARQLDSCLTYCTVRLLADGITDQQRKSGVLASLFRGPALVWLTQQLKVTPDLLNDYDEFVAQTTKAFQLDEDARRLQAARQLAGLHQKGSVQDYSLRFGDLADQAGLNDATKVALFTKGLKPKVREALIVADNSEGYDETLKEAVRIDSQFYYSGRNTQTRNDGKQRRGKDGRFKPDTVKKEAFY